MNLLGRLRHDAREFKEAGDLYTQALALSPNDSAIFQVRERGGGVGGLDKWVALSTPQDTHIQLSFLIEQPLSFASHFLFRTWAGRLRRRGSTSWPSPPSSAPSTSTRATASPTSSSA